MSERDAALLRLLDGPVSINHSDFGDSAMIRAMLNEGLIDYNRSTPDRPVDRLQLTPAGLAAARAIKEREARR